VADNGFKVTLPGKDSSVAIESDTVTDAIDYEQGSGLTVATNQGTELESKISIEDGVSSVKVGIKDYQLNYQGKDIIIIPDQGDNVKVSSAMIQAGQGTSILVDNNGEKISAMGEGAYTLAPMGSGFRIDGEFTSTFNTPMGVVTVPSQLTQIYEDNLFKDGKLTVDFMTGQESLDAGRQVIWNGWETVLFKGKTDLSITKSDEELVHFAGSLDSMRYEAKADGISILDHPSDPEILAEIKDDLEENNKVRRSRLSGARDREYTKMIEKIDVIKSQLGDKSARILDDYLDKYDDQINSDPDNENSYVADALAQMYDEKGYARNDIGSDDMKSLILSTHNFRLMNEKMIELPDRNSAEYEKQLYSVPSELASVLTIKGSEAIPSVVKYTHIPEVDTKRPDTSKQFQLDVHEIYVKHDEGRVQDVNFQFELPMQESGGSVIPWIIEDSVVKNTNNDNYAEGYYLTSTEMKLDDGDLQLVSNFRGLVKREKGEEHDLKNIPILSVEQGKNSIKVSNQIDVGNLGLNLISGIFTGDSASGHLQSKAADKLKENFVTLSPNSIAEAMNNLKLVFPIDITDKTAEMSVKGFELIQAENPELSMMNKFKGLTLEFSQNEGRASIEMEMYVDKDEVRKSYDVQTDVDLIGNYKKQLNKIQYQFEKNPNFMPLISDFFED
jgi:hypothetical protein